MLLLGLLGPGVSAEPQPAPPAFPAGVELVRLDVAAVDREGRPVTDLRAGDFEVTEKGRPREIVTFESVQVKARRTNEAPEPARVSTPATLEPEDGRYFLVFFDDVHVSAPVTDWVRQALAPFFESALQDGDWVTVVAPEERVWWTARTPWEHRLLPDLVRRLSGRFVRDPVGNGAECASGSPVPGVQSADAVDFTAMKAVEYGSRTGAEAASRGAVEGLSSVAGPPGARPPSPVYCEMQYLDAQQRIRRSLALLRLAVDSMAGWRGRKLLFLYSEGFIRAPRLDSLYDSVIAAARRADVRIHFIAAQGLSTNPSFLAESGGTDYIASATGGRSFETNDLTAPVRSVLEEATAYYLLGIRPLDSRPGEHRVQVRVRRRGVKAVARSRYFLAAPGEPTSPSDAAARALRSGLDATTLPVRVSTTPGEPGEDGLVPVALSVELPGAPAERRLDLLVAGQRLGGGEGAEDAASVRLPPSDGPQRFERPLRLRPGIWQLRVVVSDSGTGALGSVVHTLEVP